MLDKDDGQLVFKVSRNELAAVVVFQLTVMPEAESLCLLLALHVDEPMRKHLLGTTLYMAMHRFCFVKCQGRDPPVKPPFQEEFTLSKTRFAFRSTLSFSLGPGECRRKPGFLRFLCSFGWNDAEPPPPVQLYAGYAAPCAGSQDKFAALSFRDVSTLGQLQSYLEPQYQRLTWQILSGPCVITPSGPLIPMQEGVFSFIIPAASCELVNQFLYDKAVQGKDMHGPFINLGVQTTIGGSLGVTIGGSLGVSPEMKLLRTMNAHPNTNASMSDPTRQKKCAWISGNAKQAAYIMTAIPGGPPLLLTLPHLTLPHLTSPHLPSPHLPSPPLPSPHSPHLTSPPLGNVTIS